MNPKKTELHPKITLNAGMGCFVWIWLFFFQWVPHWLEALGFFVAAYLVEIVVRAFAQRPAVRACGPNCPRGVDKEPVSS